MQGYLNDNFNVAIDKSLSTIVSVVTMISPHKNNWPKFKLFKYRMARFNIWATNDHKTVPTVQDTLQKTSDWMKCIHTMSPYLA